MGFHWKKKIKVISFLDHFLRKFQIVHEISFFGHFSWNSGFLLPVQKICTPTMTHWATKKRFEHFQERQYHSKYIFRELRYQKMRFGSVYKNILSDLWKSAFSMQKLHFFTIHQYLSWFFCKHKGAFSNTSYF